MTAPTKIVEAELDVEMRVEAEAWAVSGIGGTIFCQVHVLFLVDIGVKKIWRKLRVAEYSTENGFVPYDSDNLETIKEMKETPGWPAFEASMKGALLVAEVMLT